MVQLVADDSVPGAEQCFEQPAIRVETTAVQDRIVGLMKASKRRFEFLVDFLGTANEPDRSQAKAPFVQCLPHAAWRRALEER